MDISLNTRHSVLSILYHAQVYNKRTYSWLKRSTIQHRLNKWYGVKRSLSTVSYHLWLLRRAGLIKVYERYAKGPGGTWFNLPSNRQVLGKGIVHLKRSGIKVVTWLYSWAFKGIKPPRVVAKSTTPKNPDIFTRPPRRAASHPETLETALSNTLNSLK